MHSVGRIEIRIGRTPPISRLAVGEGPRTGTGSLLHGEQAPSNAELPAWVLPLLDVDGNPVELRPLLAEVAPQALTLDAELILPIGHPSVKVTPPVPETPEIIRALWIQSLGEAEAEALHARARLLGGLLLRQDESVVGFGSNLGALPGTSYIHRLPRILFEGHDLIADNTDAAVSMGRLLEDFVQRFSTPERALPHVRVATGYLYHHGLQRILRLLENERLKTLRVLFSGKTDARTARALTSQLAQQLIEDVESAPTDDVWMLYRRAIAEGRLEFRVYTDAFLHAKLFLGWEFENNYKQLEGSYAVVGSSNLSASGLKASGNLELDVTLSEPRTNTRLKQWFDGRWEEASLPEPSILEILDTYRPQPVPTFQVDGLFDVWKAGTEGRLVEPEAHLALLAHLYAKRLDRLELPTKAAFPFDPARELMPTHEQEEGVLALVQRLTQARVAFLADSVGLGKTATALGTVWYLQRNELARNPVLIAPRKLHVQWQDDAARLHSPQGMLRVVNRHELERRTEEEALQLLDGADLLVIEEAHEALRNRNNKLWAHVRAHLKLHPDCRLLLISATPWNNRREDIFNYLLLAWNEGRLLKERYPALDVRPLKQHLPGFMVGVSGSLTATAAVRQFDRLPVATYRRVFDEVFVQRTRSSLVRRYGTVLDYPERRVHPHTTPTSTPHDALFVELESALAELSIPYREPFSAFLRAVTEVARDTAEDDNTESNLHRSFLIQLYKRAESSEFALAVSLAGVERRLVSFGEEMEELASKRQPKKALREWLEQRYLRLDEEANLDLFEDGADAEMLSPAEKVRFANLRGLLERLDDRQAKAVIRKVLEEQVAADLDRIRALRAKLTLDLDERSPKALLLSRLARDAYVNGHKPILVAGYADTALRFFLRLVSLLPDARIGLALGGDDAWLYQPTHNRNTDLSESEWTTALSLSPEERRSVLLTRSGRATMLSRADLLAAFSPRSRHSDAALFERLGGEVDVLVGSEAISVGHNLQDSTCLVQLDLPWNPMIIEQRIGRIDRRGGGRLDPESPGGRRIVDVHYCWSNAAIEKEVALRDRLKEKAGQAIQDTNFDEVLLYELVEEIQRVRTERERTPGAREQAHLASFLAQRQRALAEERTQVQGIPVGTGSELDGLRQLAAWAKARPGQEPPAPVVAAGCHTGEITQDVFRWLLSLELSPLGANGQPLAPEPFHMQLPLGAVLEGQDGASAQPDLEALVGALLRSGEGLPRPGISRAEWTRELQAIDSLLVRLRDSLLAAHNTEVNERLTAQLAPAAKRDPSSQLKLLLLGARDALKTELERVARSPSRSLLDRHREKLAFLMQRALQPEKAVELLAHQDETPLQRALVQVKSLPDKFLEHDFELLFDQICGALWETSRVGGGAASDTPPTETAELEMPAIDGRWENLRLRVLAVTFAEA
jgi:superfamily II DNA or RNA helicase